MAFIKSLSTTPPIPRILFWTLFVLTSLCFSYFFLADPLSTEDLVFAGDLKYYGQLDENSSIDNFIHGIYCVWEQTYMHDISRSGNFLAIASLCLPPWIPSAIIAACFILALWLMVELAGISSKNPAMLAIMVFLLVFGIMWDDGMFTIMFGINYTCATFLMLASIKAFLSKRPMKPWQVILLGITTGSWHESFTVALLAGFIVNLILNKPLWRNDRLILTISLAIGLTFIISAPSFWARAENFTETDFHIVRLLYAWPYWVFAWLCALCGLRRKWRSLLYDPLIIIVAVSGILIALFFLTHRLRAFYPTLLLSCIGIPWLIAHMFPNARKKLQYGIITAIAAAAGVLHLLTLTAYMPTFRSETQELQRAIEKDDRLEKRRILFVPMTDHWQAPALTLGRPNSKFEPMLCTLESYYGDKLHFVPEIFSTYGGDTGTPIKSNIGVNEYNGHLVSSLIITQPTIGVEITYGWRREYTHALVSNFIGADGYIYSSIMPVRSTISNYLGAPTACYAATPIQ